MDKLDITVLLTQPNAVIPPRTAEFPILKGTIVKADRPPRQVRGRSRRLRRPPPLVPPVPDLRPVAPGSQIHLRHHPGPDRRHAAVPGPRQARRLSPPRPRQPGRSPEGRSSSSPIWSENSTSPATSITAPNSAPIPATRRPAAPAAWTSARPEPSRRTATTSPSTRSSAPAAVPAPPSAPREPPPTPSRAPNRCSNACAPFS